MTTKQRLLLFLYGTPNIVGSALGIVGLTLYFVGLIEAFWYLIVPGLYAIGWVATPKSPTYELRFRNLFTTEQVQAELENLLREIRHKVPAQILARVESIKASILDILPYIIDINSAEHEVYVIRQTALEYLPETLENYLNLPRAFANLHPVKEGKTATQLLADQLDVLDQQLKEIVVDFNRNNTQKLLAHGRFLEEKFTSNDLLAGV